MSLPWVRQQYGVPATRGGLVRFEGDEARILSATHYLHVRMVDGTRAILHPTWHVDYQECHEAVRDSDGDEQPCDRPAVGYRYDPEYPGEGPYPVCRRHHRPPFEPEPIECRRCDGTGAITGDRYQPVDCGDCGGQDVTEAER